MKVPWRFIIGLAAGLILALGLFVHSLYGQLGVPTASSLWIYDILKKKEALAARIQGPRLFIVAGSSGLFGINAQLIQEKTGCPTINMASHAGLGLPYILYRTEKVVRPGDTVLLAIEYEFYSDLSFPNQFDDFILSHDPDYFRNLSWRDKIEMATRIPYKRIQTSLKPLNLHELLGALLPGRAGKMIQKTQAPVSVRPPNLTYAPIQDGMDCLDDNGDEVYNFAATRPQTSLQRLEDEAILEKGLPSDRTKGFTEIAAFLEWAQANHITVLATFPNIIYHPYYDAPPAKQAITTINQFYASKGIPVIGNARDAMLPENQFYDSIYHLTHEAALARTGRLIPELQPYLHFDR